MIGKVGKKLVGVCWHRNHSGQLNEATYLFGHCVVLCDLPADMDFHTKLELAIQLIERLRLPDWVLLTLVVDAFYGRNPFVEAMLGMGYDVVSRLRCDSALFAISKRPRKTEKVWPRLELAKLAVMSKNFKHKIALVIAVPTISPTTCSASTLISAPRGSSSSTPQGSGSSLLSGI